TVVRVFDEAFARLDEKQRARLRRHAELGTPILCGSEDRAGRFYLDGAGCPAQLATTLRVPAGDSRDGDWVACNRSRVVLRKMLGPDAERGTFYVTRFGETLARATG